MLWKLFIYPFSSHYSEQRTWSRWRTIIRYNKKPRIIGGIFLIKRAQCVIMSGEKDNSQILFVQTETGDKRWETGQWRPWTGDRRQKIVIDTVTDHTDVWSLLRLGWVSHSKSSFFLSFLFLRDSEHKIDQLLLLFCPRSEELKRPFSRDEEAPEYN